MRGFTAKVNSQLKGIGDVNVNVSVDTAKMRADVAAAAKAAKATVEIDASITDVKEKIAETEMALADLKAKAAADNPQLDLDIRQAEAKAASLKAKLDDLATQQSSPKVDLDTATAEAALGRVNSQLDSLRSKKVTPEVGVQIGTAEAELATLQAELTRLDHEREQVLVDVDTGGAMADLAAFGASARALVTDLHANVDVDTGAAVGKLVSFAAFASTISLGTLGTGAAIQGLASLTAAVAPAVGALALLPAAAGAAGLGIGTLGTAFSGIGGVFKAVSAASDGAASSTGKTAAAAQQSASQIASAQDRLSQAYTNVGNVRQNVDDANVRAARQVESAREALANAEEDAASRVADAEKAASRAVASALQQQQAAQRAVASAAKDLQRAQEDLNGAWEDGTRSLQDLQDQLDMGLIDQRQAALDLADARADLQKAQASGDTSAIAKAQVAYDRQVETIDELNKRVQRLSSDNTTAQAKGVAGTDAVTSANDRLADAQDRMTQAQQSAGDASRAVDQARSDGAAQVAKAQEEGSRQVASAQKALTDAEMSQVSTQRAGQQQLAAAQQQVVEAQRSLADVLTKTGAAAAGVDKVAAAMAKLSPNAKAAVNAILGLKPAWDALKLDVQDKMFAGVATRITALGGTYIPILRGAMSGLAGEMNGALTSAMDVFARPMNATGIQTALGDIVAGFHGMLAAAAPATQAFIDLFRVGSTFMPQLGTAIGNVATRFSTFISVAAGDGRLQTWISNALGVFAQLGRLVGNIGSILFSVLGTAASQGTNLLSVLVAGTGAAARFLNSVQGMAFLQTIFGNIHAALALTAPLFDAIGRTLVSTVLPAVAAALPAIGQALGSLAPAVEPLGRFIAALAPLVGQLAAAFATWLAGALQAVLPPLTAFVHFLSISPGLTLAVVSGIVLIGKSVGPMVSLLGTVSKLAPLFEEGGTAVTFLSRAFTFLTGPIGIVIGIFALLFATNEQFRGAVMNLLGVLGGLVGIMITALEPAFRAILGVFNIVSGVLAAVVVPIINALSATLQWLSPIITPLVDVFLGLKAATIAWAVAQQAGAAILVGYNAAVAAATFVAGAWAAVQEEGLVAFVAARAAMVAGTAVTYAMTAAQWLLNVAMDANPIGLVVLAIMALVGIAALVITYWAPISTFFVGLWNDIWSVVTTVANAVWSFLQQWGALILAVFVPFLGIPLLIYQYWTPISGFFVTLWNGIVAFFQGIWDWIMNIVMTVWSAIAGWLTAMFVVHYQLWMQIWGAISGFFSAIWNFIASVATTVWNAISSFFVGAFTAFAAFFSMIWNGIVAEFTIVWNWLRNIALTVWNAIVAFFAPAFYAFAAFFSMIWNGIVAAFTTVWNWLRNIAVTVWNAIVAFFQPAFSWFASFFAGVWNGIAGTFSRIWQSISDEAGRIWNGIVGIIKGAVNGVIDAANWMTDKINVVLRFLLIPTIPGIPRLEAGGIIGLARGGMLGRGVEYAARGTQIGGGFVTNGPRVVVGEGKRAHPEYVVPTDPAYRGRALELHASLSADLGLGTGTGAAGMAPMTPGTGTPGLAIGGIIGDVGSWIGDRANDVGDFASGAWKKLTDAIADASQWIGDPLNALKAGTKGALNTLMPAGVFHDSGNWMVDKVFDAVSTKIQAAEAAMSGASIGPLSASHALDIVNAAKSKGIGHAGAVIAIMTGLQESGLKIYANSNVPASMALPHEAVGHDHDSVGIFQQRQSWGPTPLLMNPFGSAQLFYNKLGRGPYGDYGAEAQRVQVSAFPGAYSKWRAAAEGLVSGAGFDAGGVASGTGLLAKQVISPERVLSPRQTVAFESLLPMLSGLTHSRMPAAPVDVNGLDGAGGPSVVQHIYPSARMDERDLADAAARRQDWALRVQG